MRTPKRLTIMVLVKVNLSKRVATVYHYLREGWSPERR